MADLIKLEPGSIERRLRLSMPDIFDRHVPAILAPGSISQAYQSAVELFMRATGARQAAHARSARRRRRRSTGRHHRALEPPHERTTGIDF